MPASCADSAGVGRDSHLTLHYRLSLSDSGEEVVSTFGSRPATLQIGQGHLAEPLERCLLGLREGESRVFDLAPGEAYGPRNPDLVQRVARSLLAADDGDAGYEPGDPVGFPAPGGGRIAGVLKALDERSALIDFNHPLAGRGLRFEVGIVGVL
ncbi:MAG: FKBP-type peptidyl-prolyl cis-trans isomerase [Burkholderiaceae bacterium]|nr:FKBP-type peptidyl-prolyl cis-trans isomerase [Burkholderiaceae bacterium]